MNKIRNTFYTLSRFAASLKLAVIVIMSLTLTLAGATFYESFQGTKAVQALVYRSWWFNLVLILLGINIFSVAAIRYPWKKRQLGFVLAHAGILILLFGSALTRQFGIDGSMPLATGETSNLVTIDEPQLEVWHQDQQKWLFKEEFNPYRPFYKKTTLSGLQIHIEQVLTHATPVLEYVPTQDTTAMPAVLIEIAGASTGIAATQWMQANDSQTGHLTLGLADVSFAFDGGNKINSHPRRNPHHAQGVQNPNSLRLLARSDGNIRYQVSSSQYGTQSGTVIRGQGVKTGWRDFKFKILKYIPHAATAFQYQAFEGANTQDDVPSAILLKLQSHEAASSARWMGYGDSLELTLGTEHLLVRYGPRYISLPFALKLNKFEMNHYPGTTKAMTYSSSVKLSDPSTPGHNQKDTLINMNEPLTHRGFTFYQASFQETDKDPISVLSVGRDPGRNAKYLGSILIVLGIIVMYTQRTLEKKFLKERPSSP